VVPDLERQPGPVGIAEIDALPIADVNRWDPAIVDENPVQAAVVERHPSALILIEAQDDVRPRYQRIGDADVCA
jgi:hypothetical protein